MTTTPRIIFLEHLENGVLTDATSVTLADPSGSYGIRESLSEETVVPASSPATRVGLGQYEFDISLLDRQTEYDVFWRVLDSNGNVEYIYGVIPKVKTKETGDGPQVPAGAIPEIVELPNEAYFADGYYGHLDGVIDAYKYDLDGDNIAESWDFDNDGRIDSVDVGKAASGVGGKGAHTDAAGNLYDARGVRIGLGGNGLATGGGNLVGPPDGIPDVPSPKGTPAQNGTFGGQYGYDGLNGQIPATGGARTNRDPRKGSGHWDGISFAGIYNVPMTPRGMWIKDKAHAITRAMLKDTDPTCYAFTEDEVDILLESSLHAFNAKPTFTNLQWGNLQERWIDIIAKGAVIFALYAQGLLESGREFVINEQGVSFQPAPVSSTMYNYASALLAHYERELLDIKQNFRPIPASVGQFSTLSSSPALQRLRHLREKKIY